MNKLDSTFEITRITNYVLYRTSSFDVTVGRILATLLVFVGFFVISFFVRRHISKGLKKKGVKNHQTIVTTCKFVHWVIMLVGFFVSLKLVGIDLSTFFAAGALLTVGLGFALQNITQNFVSGIILFTERSIQTGDILEIDGKVVRVERVGFRATTARTRFEEEIIIPNSRIVQSIVINYTLHDNNHMIKTSVGVSRNSDMKKVKDILQKVAHGISWRQKDGRVTVLLTEFGNSSVNFGVFVEAPDPWPARIYASELNLAIWWALKEAGITIAFPQLDVHFDKPISEITSIPKI